MGTEAVSVASRPLLLGNYRGVHKGGHTLEKDSKKQRS